METDNNLERIDILFSPHNDMDVKDIDTVNSHHKMIKQGKYSEAVSILDENEYNSGFRSSLFNTIQNKIRKLQLYLMNKVVAKPEELFSDTEPTDDQMEGKLFWIKPL